MHYKPKDVPQTGFVANADALMREFNRAEQAGNEIDQSNLANLGILFSYPALPSSTADGTTFTHDAGTTLLLVDPNDGVPEPMTIIDVGTAVTTREEWLPIYDGALSETPAVLTFTLTNAMPMIIIGQVEWQVAGGASAAFRGIRLRVLLDGTPLDTTSTCHAEQQGAPVITYWGGYVEQIVFLSAGDHRIEMQGADMRQADAEIAGVFRRTILAMGFPR